MGLCSLQWDFLYQSDDIFTLKFISALQEIIREKHWIEMIPFNYSRRNKEKAAQAQYDRRHINDEETYTGHAMYGGSLYSKETMSYKGGQIY